MADAPLTDPPPAHAARVNGARVNGAPTAGGRVAAPRPASLADALPTRPVPLDRGLATQPVLLDRGLATQPVLLDGGLATQLEAMGHDLSDGLWSARLLADEPGAIVSAHLEFLRAGADVITTASYQATLHGFAARGHDGAGALRRSVDLAREAIERYPHPSNRPLWIAASVGPYGAMLADGSEYRGNYGRTVAELVAFHRPRLEILADAGADVLALETVPDVREAEALLIALDGIGVPAWLSYSLRCDIVHSGFKDGGPLTSAGQPLTEAFGLVAGVAGIIAVGANCSAPAAVTAAIGPAVRHSGKPAVAYPNSGEVWDPTGRSWTGPGAAGPGTAGPGATGDLPVAQWITDGARLIGGCCRVTPADIATLRRSMP